MKKYSNMQLRRFAPVVLLSALGHLTGCLFLGDPGHISADPDAAASMEGVRVELIRHSSGCDSAESKGLVVEVGPGLEFPADAVRALQPNCELAINPGVEVHIEDRAVILDFSSVAEHGHFPDNEFEGYILDIVRTADAPFMGIALLDSQATTLNVVQGDLSFDRDRVAINLAGRDFDSNSFLKINLFLIETSAGDDGGPSDER